MPDPIGPQKVADLEHAVGRERIAQFIHGRLIALGAERVVVQTGLIPAGPEWIRISPTGLSTMCRSGHPAPGERPLRHPRTREGR